VSPPRPEKRERICQNAGERLQIPCQPAPEEERCHLLACDLDVILEEELQRQLSQPLGLRKGRGKNSKHDNQAQWKQMALVVFCPRA